MCTRDICSQVIRYGTPWTYTSLTYSKHSVTYLYSPVENKFRLDYTNTMTTKPKVLVTRGDHDPAAIARLSEFCDVEGGFQLEFVSISRVINHMTCYNSSALIGGKFI